MITIFEVKTAEREDGSIQVHKKKGQLQIIHTNKKNSSTCLLNTDQ